MIKLDMISTTNQLTNSTNVQQFETVRKWLVKNQKKVFTNFLILYV